MPLHRSTRPRLMLLLFMFVLFAGVLALAPTAHASDVALTGNALQARQFQIDQLHAVTPAGATIRQSLRCWQVAQGTWNGQSLDGLSLVLIQPLADGAQPSRQANIYISEFATPAQREALLAALLASNPEMFSARSSAGIKIEPAFIQIEQIDAQTLVLHLGLVA